MNTTTVSTKLAALALALMVNSVIMGGVAYMFNDRLQAATSVSVAGAVPSIAAVA